MSVDTQANDPASLEPEAALGYWQQAFDEHGPALLAFLTSRTRRREDAEDLLQETFVRAIRAEGALRDPSKLRSYLMTIAHNTMINSYRQKRPQHFAEGSDSAARLLESTPAETAPTDSAVLLSDLTQKLSTVLNEMTPPLRAAFEAAILRQESYDEIARALGWTKGQVRVNVFRARKKAIEHLGHLLSLEQAG